MGVSVSNGTLWDTRRPARGKIALPSMGALLGGPYSTVHIRGTKMGSTETTSEFKESSALGDSEEGFRSEASHNGAGRRSPACSGRGVGPVLRDSADWCLSEAPKMEAAGRGRVEQEGSVRGTPARIFWSSPIKGNSCAWGFRKKEHLGRIHACRGWVRLQFSGGNTYLLTIYA